MLVVQVFVHVLPEQVAAFKAATLDNATNSVLEPGIARFDVLQHADDSTRFTLIEAYLTESAPAEHKATAHYARWRDTVEPMMASPRTNVRYESLFFPILAFAVRRVPPRSSRTSRERAVQCIRIDLSRSESVGSYEAREDARRCAKNCNGIF